MRKVGCVLEVNLKALEQVKRERSAGQRQQHGVAVGCCRCGSAHPPRDHHGGNRIARRQKQRANRGRSRDGCTVARALAKSLSPLQGGSDSRTSATTSKLQILQPFSVAGTETGSQIQSSEDQAIYVGMVNPTDRLAMQGNRDGVTVEMGTKAQKEDLTAEESQPNKAPRGINDGLLLVVVARINGHLEIGRASCRERV